MKYYYAYTYEDISRNFIDRIQSIIYYDLLKLVKDLQIDKLNKNTYCYNIYMIDENGKTLIYNETIQIKDLLNR